MGTYGSQGGIGSDGLHGWKGIQGSPGTAGQAISSSIVAKTGTGTTYILGTTSATNTSNTTLSTLYTSATSATTINTSNGVYMKAGYLYSPSDVRIKDNISILSDDIVNEVFDYEDELIKTFTLKSNNKEKVGFIAQELKKFIPEAITITEDGYYGVDYNCALAKLLGIVFRKIKWQDQIIKELLNK